MEIIEREKISGRMRAEISACVEENTSGKQP